MLFKVRKKFNFCPRYHVTFTNCRGISTWRKGGTKWNHISAVNTGCFVPLDGGDLCTDLIPTRFAKRFLVIAIHLLQPPHEVVVFQPGISEGAFGRYLRKRTLTFLDLFSPVQQWTYIQRESDFISNGKGIMTEGNPTGIRIWRNLMLVFEYAEWYQNVRYTLVVLLEFTAKGLQDFHILFEYKHFLFLTYILSTIWLGILYSAY